MKELHFIEHDKGIEILEVQDGKIRGVILTENADTLDFHLAKHAIWNYGEMVTRHQFPFTPTTKKKKWATTLL